MKPVKTANVKPLKIAHTSPSQKGMGDFYGQSKKEPIGKLRGGFSIDKPVKMKTKKAPKSLA